MESISPLSGIATVGSSTSNAGGKDQSGLPRQGQTLKATVAEAKGGNIFVLDINGTKLTAQARIPLNVGQILQLQVASTSPQVELRIISDSKNLFQGKPITLLGNAVDIKAFFQALKSASPSPFPQMTGFSRQTIESYFQFSQNLLAGKEGGGLLKQFIDRLGLSFEALLARGEKQAAQTTLKSALLELSAVFKGAGELAESTNKLLNTLEMYQLAQLQLDKDNQFIFPLPVPFLEKGYLIIEDYSKQNDSDADSDDNTRFSLHLALEGLGNLRIEILKSMDGLYIRFISDSKEKLDFLESFKDDLLVNMIDSPVLGVSFFQDTNDPSADLLRRLIPKGESLVNTTV